MTTSAAQPDDPSTEDEPLTGLERAFLRAMKAALLAEIYQEEAREVPTSPSETDSDAARRSDMFSPMVAIRSVSSPCTSRLLPGNGAAAILAISPALSSAIFVAALTNF